MTRESGTDPANRSGGYDLQIIRKGNSLQFISDLTFSSDRKIFGCAHFPAVDRENELITPDAFRHSLEHFMKHPILHVQHTERPVGIVRRAEIDESGALNLEGEIFNTPDTDDVWNDILSGKLNKFSIYGRREKGSPECQLPPEQRLSPCVTEKLTLYSISVVGDNAINPNTYLKVAKGGDTTPFGEYKDFEECVEENKDKDNPEGYCATVHKKITGEWPSEKGDMEPETEEQKSCKVAKSEGLDAILERLARIEEVLAKLVETDKEVHSELGKSEDENVEQDQPVEKAEEPVTPQPDIVTKAVVDAEVKKAVDELRKAYDERFTAIEKAYSELRETVESMKKTKIEKGGNIVMVVPREQIENNLKLNQIDLIGAI